MRVMPWLFAIAGLICAFGNNYDQAAYNMAAGVFFMILPQYFEFLEIRRR
jgi:hypothetical protein